MKSKLFIAGASAAAILAVAGIASVALAAAGGPTVVLSSTASSTTNLSSIPITATFSGTVTGLSSSSITVTNGSISSFSGSGADYTFDLLPSAQGTTTVMIPADVASSTASSTGNQASNTLTFDFDTTAPVIATVTPVASTTSNTTPSYTFSSSEAGMINLSGGCTSSTTAAASGDNTITFNTLAPGTYACSLSVTDAAGNTSNSLPIDFTEAASVAPVISDIAVSDIGTSSAMITWNTDQASIDDVAYGTSTSYGFTTALETSASTTHSTTLSNLSDNTLYHFQVSAGNGTATSTSPDMTFSTASSSLAIDNITSIQSSGVADNTFADGWQWDVNFSIPVTQNAFRIRFSDWGNASSSFPTANDVQIWSPESTNATSASSAILETDNGYSGWLYFPTGTNDIDLYVNVKIPFGTANGSYSSDFTAETYPSTATSTAI